MIWLVHQKIITLFKGKKVTVTTPFEKQESLLIPEASKDNNKIINYLRNERGIDIGIISDCMDKGKLYQTKTYSNVAFVSRNQEDEIKHIFLRGTIKTIDHETGKIQSFKMDSKGSDKNFPFTLGGNPNATKVYVFESSIDVLSHATLCKINNMEQSLTSSHRIALHGTSFGALKTFLKDNPNITTIVPCLDGDDVGKRRSKKMQEEFSQMGYIVENHRPPKVGKDYNEMLLSCKEFGINKNISYQTAQTSQINEDPITECDGVEI